MGFIGARRHAWALVVVFVAIFLGGYASQSWVSTLNAMKRMFEHQTYNEREETPLEKAVGEKWAEGEILLKHLPRKDGQSDAFFPMLDDAIFVGHLVTDLDSIAGAIGAAHLYGGAPARASEINTETEFALNLWGVDLPPHVE